MLRAHRGDLDHFGRRHRLDRSSSRCLPGRARDNNEGPLDPAAGGDLSRPESRRPAEPGEVAACARAILRGLWRELGRVSSWAKSPRRPLRGPGGLGRPLNGIRGRGHIRKVGFARLIMMTSSGSAKGRQSRSGARRPTRRASAKRFASRSTRLYDARSQLAEAGSKQPGSRTPPVFRRVDRHRRMPAERPVWLVVREGVAASIDLTGESLCRTKGKLPRKA